MTETMWMIEAMIQSFKLDAVTLALQQVRGFGGMTVSECRGFGHGKIQDDLTPPDGTHIDSFSRSIPDLIDFTPKLKLEIAIAGRGSADAVVATIARVAHTGRRGDGKIFMWPLTHVVRIRTQQADGQAL